MLPEAIHAQRKEIAGRPFRLSADSRAELCFTLVGREPLAVVWRLASMQRVRQGTCR